VTLVTYSDGVVVKASGVGSVRFKAEDGSIVKIHGVLWIPSQAMCLFSVKQVSGKRL
jgi:hypothetical protein